jgi:hypothetical protein
MKLTCWLLIDVNKPLLYAGSPLIKTQGYHPDRAFTKIYSQQLTHFRVNNFRNWDY